MEKTHDLVENTKKKLNGPEVTKLISKIEIRLFETNYKTELEDINLAKTMLFEYDKTLDLIIKPHDSWQELKMEIATQFGGATMDNEEVITMFWQKAWNHEITKFSDYKHEYVKLVYVLEGTNILKMEEYFESALKWFIYHMPCSIFQNEIAKILPLHVVRCKDFDTFLQGMRLIDTCLKNTKSWKMKHVLWIQNAWDNNFDWHDVIQDVL